jgi:hypothetical protein
VLGCEVRDPSVPTREQLVIRHDERVRSRVSHRHKGGVQLVRTAQLHHVQVHPQCLGCRGQGVHPGSVVWGGRIRQHNDAIAIASVAQDYGAEVPYLGTIGTRQYDLDLLSQTMPSKAQHLIVVYEAGPCGYWLYGYLTKKAYDCWVVAPSLMPTKAGDRVKTDHRDAGP